MAKLAVTNVGQMATLDPNRPGAVGLVRDAALLSDAGRIVRVGPRSEVEPLIDGECEVLDAGGRAALPGFVDAHTHLVYAGDRLTDFEMRSEGKSYAEIARAGGGIASTVAATRKADESELTALAERRAGWMLRCGTTTAEVKSGYGLTTEQELKLLRVARCLADAPGVPRLVPTFLGAHAVPPEFVGRPDAYVDLLIEETLPAVCRERLAVYADAFCEEGYFTPAQCRRLLGRAKRMGLGLRLHADQLTAGGGAELAAELGAATADHLEQTGPSGIKAMAKAGVQPVLLPGSVFALGSARYPDAQAMLKAGLDLALATDFNPGSSPTPSMPFVMALACTQMRMSPAEALRAATIGAARSLGLGSEVGSLEPGKRCDLVLLDADDWREAAYWLGVGLVEAVVLQGQVAWRRA